MSHFCEMCEHSIEPGEEIEWTPRSFVCRSCAPPEILDQEAIQALAPDARLRVEFGKLFFASLTSIE